MQNGGIPGVECLLPTAGMPCATAVPAGTGGPPPGISATNLQPMTTKSPPSLGSWFIKEPLSDTHLVTLSAFQPAGKKWFITMGLVRL